MRHDSFLTLQGIVISRFVLAEFLNVPLVALQLLKKGALEMLEFMKQLLSTQRGFTPACFNCAQALHLEELAFKQLLKYVLSFVQSF